MMIKTCHRLLATSVASAAIAAAMLTPAWGETVPAGPAAATDPAFLSRGREMMTTGNYRGTIDQLNHIHTENIPLSPAASEEFLYLLGSAYYHTADPRCLQLLEEFLRDNPASVHARDARVNIADFHFFAHDWLQAADAYADIDIEALDPSTRHRCAYREGLSLIKCGRYVQARPLIKSVAGIKDYSLAASYYDAYLDYVAGKDEYALGKFMRVASDMKRNPQPDNSESLQPSYYIAQILFRQHKWDKCMDLCTKLLRESQPEEMEELIIPTKRILGIAYYEKGHYARARKMLKEYVDAAGDNATPDALYVLGSCQYRARDMQEAAENFSRVVDEDSSIGQGAALYLGQIEAAIGSPSAAAMNFERAYRMNYDRKVAETALYNYVAARTKGGNIPFDSSVQMLEEFIRIYPQSEFAPIIERHLATLYYGQGDFTHALEAIDRIASPSAADKEILQKILYAAGSSALSSGNPRNAASLLQRCAAIRGADSDINCQANIWLGDALYALADYSGAERAYAAAQSSGRAGNNSALLEYDLGYALLMQDKFGQAQRYFRKAAASSLPADMRADAEMRVADCKYYTGDYEGALTDFARLKSGDNADYALYRHAQMLGLRGDISGKIRELEGFEREYSGSRWLPNALSELADTYAAQGDNVKAAAAYGRMLDKYPVAPGAARAALGRASALMASGDTDEAVEVYRQLITSRPASDEARSADRELRRYYASTHQLGEYAEFIEDIPGYSLDAADLDDLAYASAEGEYLDDNDSIEAIRKYIMQFPSGRHIAEAYSIYAAWLNDRGDRNGALKAYRELERRGGAEYASEAYTGIMRNADNSATQLEYARKLRSTGGADADALEEAAFYEATALIDSGSAKSMREGEMILRRLAENPYSLSGARSAVTLAAMLLDNGDAEGARDRMEDFTASGSGQQYWVARGFIVLADAYTALGKDHLAREYLRSLKQNYPGDEDDIRRMIAKRLK